MPTDWEVGDPVYVVSSNGRDAVGHDYVIKKVGRKWVEYGSADWTWVSGRFEKATNKGERCSAYRNAAEHADAVQRSAWMQQTRRTLASEAYRLDFDTLDKIAAALGWDRYTGGPHA
jgi:hypothetical protein